MLGDVLRMLLMVGPAIIVLGGARRVPVGRNAPQFFHNSNPANTQENIGKIGKCAVLALVLPYLLPTFDQELACFCPLLMCLTASDE